MPESRHPGEQGSFPGPGEGDGRRERETGPAEVSQASVGPFASDEDYARCAALHRRYGTTYFFASRRFPRSIRRRVDAVYGFVRVPDEWVDNPGTLTVEQRAELLARFRAELIRGLDGVCPTDPVLRAFVDTMIESAMPLDEPLLFLDAMEMDLKVTRYPTYAHLREYMRGSAAAVGLMMCHVVRAPKDSVTVESAMALGEAMQLTNFLRDVGEDLRRGRIYLPKEDMERFGVTESHLEKGKVTESFKELMRFEVARARSLYQVAEQGIDRLPKEMRKAIWIARVLYARILDRIEANGYDVFSGRARTSPAEKLLTAFRIALGAKR